MLVVMKASDGDGVYYALVCGIAGMTSYVGQSEVTASTTIPFHAYGAHFCTLAVILCFQSAMTCCSV